MDFDFMPPAKVLRAPGARPRPGCGATLVQSAGAPSGDSGTHLGRGDAGPATRRPRDGEIGEGRARSQSPAGQWSMIYSYRRAAMGSTFVARRAGR